MQYAQYAPFIDRHERERERERATSRRAGRKGCTVPASFCIGGGGFDDIVALHGHACWKKTFSLSLSPSTHSLLAVANGNTKRICSPYVACRTMIRSRDKFNAEENYIVPNRYVEKRITTIISLLCICVCATN